VAQLSSETLHATSVAINGKAVLIMGPSGSGKSDLALRLLDRGAVLISDDQTLVRQTEGQLLANSFGTIKGKMEVRGIGIIARDTASDVPVALIIDLRGATERFPLETQDRQVAGKMVPVVSLSPFESSAPIKVELALGQITR
jgi:serine kinase of HPr protein (carbohydrate metabolism regulator)